MTRYVFKQGRLYRGRYRLDDQQKVTDVALRTSDKQVATKRLEKIVAEQQQEADSGIPLSQLREAGDRPLKDHLADYLGDVAARNRAPMYVKELARYVGTLIDACKWVYPRQIRADDFTAWRARQKTTSAKTKNEYLAGMRTFDKWMVQHQRMSADPLDVVGKVETRGQRVFERRALSQQEQSRLLATTPMPRRAAYAVALYTGARRGELQALQWGDVILDNGAPILKLRACTTKNHQEAPIPLHSDVADLLRQMKPENADGAALVFGRLPRMKALLDDWKAASIAYKDAQGARADFHSLRHTFCTNLARAGVPVRLAMEAMRHSDARLTALVYTDVSQLAVRPAIDKLPGFAGPASQRASHTPDVSGLLLASAGTPNAKQTAPQQPAAETDRREPAPTGTERGMVRATGFEPVTSSV